MGFFENIKSKWTEGLAKTRESFMGKFDVLLGNSSNIDDDLYEEIEEILISSDIGVNTTMDLIEEIKAEVKEKRITDPSEISNLLRTNLELLLGDDLGSSALNLQADNLTVIAVVGVNGVGKTTSIGKLAWQLKQQGKKVILAAGDTFRAAAIEQLKVWGQRSDVDVIAQQTGSDPAAVIFDAIQAAKARNADVLICDTAGRLHNKTNLMNELNKIYRVIGNEIKGAPHEVLLVLDATTGQNALQQARTFGGDCGVTGIILTKLDGTAKGGIVLAIAKELNIPVKFVGLGEKQADLQEFDKKSFVEALFDNAVKKNA